jgi:tetratricopeptide (TPR) repeat protein
MQRSIVLILIFMCQFAFAQQSRIDKAQAALESENYEDCLYNADKALENEATAKDVMAFYYRAKALFELTKDENYVIDNPNTRKDAIAAAIKLRKNKNWDGSNKDMVKLIADVAKDCEKEAKKLIAEKKGPKAKKEYENIVKLNNSVHAQYMIGNLTYDEDKKAGIEIYQMMIDSQYNPISRGERNVEVLLEPFTETVKYYNSIGAHDKALKVIQKGLTVFPDNNELLAEQNPLFLKSLTAKKNLASNDSIVLALKVYEAAFEAYPEDTAIDRLYINYVMKVLAKKDRKLKRPNYDTLSDNLAEMIAAREKIDRTKAYVWLVNYFSGTREGVPMQVYIDKYVAATHKAHPDWGYLQLSDVYLAQGKEDLSRTIYEMAIRLYPESEALKTGKIPGAKPPPAPPKKKK